mmetsp:Transcript_21860/g.24935  ORF Transcript_21860/g.24935 Transcript_21860/m.24935 type:complete len:81 (-) Transcript_21860:760-1002(-)
MAMAASQIRNDRKEWDVFAMFFHQFASRNARRVVHGGMDRYDHVRIVPRNATFDATAAQNIGMNVGQTAYRENVGRVIKQ